jgi:hypothetical protein
MKLFIPLPSTQVRRDPDQRLVSELAPGAMFSVSPMRPAAELAGEWRRRLTPPPRGRLREVEEAGSTADTGWPFTLITSETLDADGIVLERRVDVYFEIGLFAAVASLEGPGLARAPQLVAEVRALARQAVPDFYRDRASALHEVFAGF